MRDRPPHEGALGAREPLERGHYREPRSARGGRRRALTRSPGALGQAFESAAGPAMELCPPCGGAPCPPEILAWVDRSCPKCRGLLDEDGRPIERDPSRRGQPYKCYDLGHLTRADMSPLEYGDY